MLVVMVMQEQCGFAQEKDLLSVSRLFFKSWDIGILLLWHVNSLSRWLKCVLPSSFGGDLVYSYSAGTAKTSTYNAFPSSVD